MEIFDCNCSIGGPIPAFRYACNAIELIQEMDFCGIDNALVYHADMRFSLPFLANSKLLQEIKDIID